MTEQAQNPERIQVTINGLLNDLKAGLTRDDIAVKYDLTKTEVKDIFRHPSLAKKKTIKPKVRRWELIDDTQAAPEENVEQQVEEIQQDEQVEQVQQEEKGWDTEDDGVNQAEQQAFTEEPEQSIEESEDPFRN